MGENSKIEWTDHTFNPWIGCTKVSSGCAHCYAERDMERYGKAKWGAGQPRVRTAASTWAQPLKWNRAAAKAGVRARVFCASLADVFDPEVPIEWLDNLFDLIDQCQNLDWLLLTKRPHLIMSRIGDVFERHLNGGGRGPDFASCWIGGMPPPNVWIGTTVEDQQRADERIPWLLHVPARVRFLSCEPLLGQVDVTQWLWPVCESWPAEYPSASAARAAGAPTTKKRQGLVLAGSKFIDWIICGGESGPHARPMHPDWARGLRDQAQAAGVPFMFKQWGEWQPISQIADHDALYLPAPEHDPEAVRRCRVETGVHHLDASFQPLQFADWNTGAMQVFRVGKVRAGRMLDGRTWDGVPT